MSRYATFVFAALVLAVSACSGNPTSSTSPFQVAPGGTGATSAPPTTTPCPPTPTPSPQAIKEKQFNDHFRGGIAIGADNLVYAVGQNSIDVFDQQLDSISQQVAQLRGRQTWPAPPKKLTPTGSVAAAGNTINAIATAPTASPGGSQATSDAAGVPSPAPSTRPALAQYDVTTHNWFNVSYGEPGEVWPSLTSPVANGVFVVGDRLTTKGWAGFLQGFGIGCVSPSFTYPLGASAIGPDGNLWVATEPKLNANGSNATSNPSMIFDVDVTTGTIKLSFMLPAGSHVSAISNGSSGVWFTDDGLDKIGFASLSGGAPTFFNLPNNGKAHLPLGISQDSSGAVWFTEFNGKKVGYIDPLSHQITEFNTTQGAHGIVGCIPGQVCPNMTVFFTEDTIIGSGTKQKK
jgi:hypothetical protein